MKYVQVSGEEVRSNLYFQKLIPFSIIIMIPENYAINSTTYLKFYRFHLSFHCQWQLPKFYDQAILRFHYTSSMNKHEMKMKRVKYFQLAQSEMQI